MTTVIDLTPEEVAALKELTNESDVAAAVRTAMNTFLRQARRERLKNLSGRVEMQDNWRDLENAELESDHGADAGLGPD